MEKPWLSVGLEPRVVGILEPEGLMAVDFWQFVFGRKESKVLAILQHPPPPPPPLDRKGVIPRAGVA